MVVHGTIRIELTRRDSHSSATDVEFGSSTFVDAIFSDLLTAAEAVSRFLPRAPAEYSTELNLLLCFLPYCVVRGAACGAKRINAKSSAQLQIDLRGVSTESGPGRTETTPKTWFPPWEGEAPAEPKASVLPSPSCCSVVRGKFPLREGEAPAEPKVSFPCSAKPVARAFLLGPVP